MHAHERREARREAGFSSLGRAKNCDRDQEAATGARVTCAAFQDAVTSSAGAPPNVRERVGAMQIREQLDVILTTRRNNAGEHRTGSRALVTAGEEPVLATDRNRTDRALGGVVVDLENTVLCVATCASQRFSA